MKSSAPFKIKISILQRQLEDAVNGAVWYLRSYHDGIHCVICHKNHKGSSSHYKVISQECGLVLI